MYGRIAYYNLVLLTPILHLYVQFDLRYYLSSVYQLEHFYTLGDIFFQAHSSTRVEIPYTS
jgi:hypothetical protein